MPVLQCHDNCSIIKEGHDTCRAWMDTAKVISILANNELPMSQYAGCVSFHLFKEVVYQYHYRSRKNTPKEILHHKP